MWKLEKDASRFRQGHSNAYLVAKIGFDTEENGPVKFKIEKMVPR